MICSRLLTKILRETLLTSAAVCLVWVLFSHTNLLLHTSNTVKDLYGAADSTKQFVILLGGTGTGSNILGQLFNQNPHFLYIFEPFDVQHLLHLHQRGLIKGAEERSTLDDLQLLWLKQVLEECETGDHVIYPYLEKYGGCEEDIRMFGKCNSSDSHRTELCVLRNTVVLKINRLLQLEYLNEIQDTLQHNNVRIIHLIRDPRDVIRHRFKFKYYYYKDRFPVTHEVNTEHKVGLAAEEWCTRQLDDILYAERNPPVWLKDRYTLITFPELMSDLLSISTELYTFLGQSLPGPVLTWIKEQDDQKSTEAWTKGQGNQWDKEINLDQESKWSRNLTRIVEEECKPLIMKMGLPFHELDIQYTDSYY